MSSSNSAVTAEKFCPNRIKPKMLREQKTEALLVFIRTILEESIEENDKIEVCSDEDAKVIYDILANLLNDLQNHVVNFSYLNYVRSNSEKNHLFNILATKESPLIVYYNSLAHCLVSSFPNGKPWIPELIVIALLSEWIIEEEKSIFLYPFLKDIDYIELLTKFEESKDNIDKDKKEIVLEMYKISSTLIERLKTIKFKANKYKTKKRRR